VTSRRLTRALVELAFSVSVAALGLALALALVVVSGADASAVAETFIEGSFGTNYAISATVAKMIPLVLVGLGWILVFKGGRFQIGFPGQIMIGGLCAGAVGLHIPGSVQLPFAVLAGVLGGGLLAALAAWLWAKYDVNEILSTLLLNLIALQVVAWAVRGPLQEQGGVLPQSDPLASSARWPVIEGYPALHWDLVLVPIAVVAVALVITRSNFGLRLRMVGSSERAARYAGVSPVRIGVYSIVASGMLAGLAGSSLVLAGGTPNVSEGFEAGYGFQGIVVGLLARNSPVGCIPAALLFAALRQGGGVVEAQVGVSSALVGVAQGLVVLLVLVGTTALVLLERRWRDRALRAAHTRDSLRAGGGPGLSAEGV
jgi:ABC-type uncharacterized transport system permease subunit